ncbi:MAG: ABC transporter ATP-binding protein [Ktedonobacteraceae bacterium]
MHISLKRYLALLVTYLKPQWPRALLMALCLLAGIGLELLDPQILRYFIDTALAGGASASLVLAGALFIVVSLALFGLTVATSYLSEYVAWTATNQLRSDLVAHCLALDMAFHKAHTSGELIERIDADVDALSNFFSEFVVHLLGNVLLAAGIIVAFYLIDWRVGVVMSAVAVLAFVILLSINRRGLPYWVKLRQVNADYSSFLGEYLAGTEDIRGNGAANFVMLRFYELLRRWWPLYRKANYLDYALGATGLFIFVCASALAFTLGAYLWSIGAVTVGTVYVMWSYTDMLSTPISRLQNQLQDFQKAQAAVQRIDDLLRTRPAIRDGVGTPLPADALSVTFADVSFSYEADGDAVLRAITFTLAARRILGVVGRTGSGKTTLARLLFRLYDPQSGAIRLGDTPIASATLRDLRQRVGMVTQDVQLFHASVRDNLTFFDGSLPDTRILAVLDDMGLTAWYRRLPQGLDTLLSSDGAGLSAGEAQLLAFARVFLKNPGLVILDEASSRLDPATEQLIERATARLLAGRTGIVIAHRLATLQKVDEIMVIEDGAIREYGPRAALASDGASRFASLLQTGLEEVQA